MKLINKFTRKQKQKKIFFKRPLFGSNWLRNSIKLAIPIR